MSKATYPLKLPISAKEDGVSLNQWIASAVAQKVGAVETAAGFFRARAGGAEPEQLHWLRDRTEWCVPRVFRKQHTTFDPSPIVLTYS